VTTEHVRNTDKLHTCNYYCHNPDCIKAQRDYLRDRVVEFELVLSDRDKDENKRNMIGIV